MLDPSNLVSLRGRICQNPMFNPNGPKSVFLLLAIKNNYKSKATGNYESQFIPLVGFRNNAQFIHDHFVNGQCVNVLCSILTKSERANNGKSKTNISLKIEHITPNESKNAVLQRQAKNQQQSPSNYDAAENNDLTDEDIEHYQKQFEAAFGYE